jgi:hypothetical protein
MSLTQTELLLALAVLLLLAVAVWLWMRNRRLSELKTQFGPEYDVRPLTAETRGAFVERWRQIQADFVDEPSSAVTHADDLLGEVMSERGYPVRDFDQRAEEYP